MQYVFFNNDSRFYKMNVNLLNLLKTKNIYKQRVINNSDLIFSLNLPVVCKNLQLLKL